MKNKDIKKMNKEDLQKQITKSETDIRGIKFRIQGVTNKNTKLARDAKKTIARAKTALRAQLG